MSKKVKMIRLGLCFLLSLVAAGCVDTKMMFLGNSPSPAMNVVALHKNEARAETWQTFDLVINYEYIQNEEFVDISGEVVLSEHYQGSYSSVSQLFVYFFFLDENWRVLKTANLVRSMTGSVEEIMTFSNRYSVPPDATSFSFGYDGRARDMQSLTSFYELPLSKK